MDNAIDFKAFLEPHLIVIWGHTGMEAKAKLVGRVHLRFSAWPAATSE